MKKIYIYICTLYISILLIDISVFVWLAGQTIQTIIMSVHNIICSKLGYTHTFLTHMSECVPSRGAKRPSKLVFWRLFLEIPLFRSLRKHFKVSSRSTRTHTCVYKWAKSRAASVVNQQSARSNKGRAQKKFLVNISPKKFEIFTQR